MKLGRFIPRRLGVAAVLWAGLGLGGSALAQAPGCRADLEKFCPGVEPGGGRIAACLKKNAAQLSPGCKERVAEMRDVLEEVHQACEDDVQTLCPGIRPGGGRIAACLKENAAKVSAGCKARLAEARKGKKAN
jgi:hypothetical protein